MKPDWKDAPDWAQWLAMDRNGAWVWHELKPETVPWDGGGFWRNRGLCGHASTLETYWMTSLEERPDES